MWISGLLLLRWGKNAFVFPPLTAVEGEKKGGGGGGVCGGGGGGAVAPEGRSALQSAVSDSSPLARLLTVIYH